MDNHNTKNDNDGRTTKGGEGLSKSAPRSNLGGDAAPMATKPSPRIGSNTTRTPVGVSSGSRLEVTGAKPPTTEVAKGGSFMRGGIASTSRGNSARVMKGSTGGKSKAALARKLKSDRRLAAKIVERYGDKHVGQVSEQHASTLEWAKKVLSEDDRAGPETSRTEPAVKRQRSHEGETSLIKKPRTGKAPTFSEIAKGAGAIVLGVLDRSREDGAISHDEWKRVAAAISSVFLRVVKENPGPPPKCVSAGWHQGLHKLTSCADERSATLYRKAVSQVGEVWKGARLEAVAKGDLPLRPRARVWLPAEPSNPSEIEEILRYCNPSLPTQDWKVLRLERTDEPYRQALIMLNTESIGPLSKTKGAISYGFEMVVLKVLPSDARADGPQAAVAAVDVTGGTDGQATVEIDASEGADGQMAVEVVDPDLSDVASVGGGSSIGDSVFSLEQLFEEVRVDHDLSAEIAPLEESLKDEIPPD
ncbi:uncharacterized protein LOC125779308 [Bactrocera dorsalis]|uniref:Uncharacterized protein LOC125779308 n=1 Tax=Bactrocera dorsalis TaxID=27457 RepID=A0ABM3K4Z9_BACDO|nr:uncharacterized protein LOC125779308 [Bactrocera dorsalis]